jgi:hypothetical protein
MIVVEEKEKSSPEYPSRSVLFSALVTSATSEPHATQSVGNKNVCFWIWGNTGEMSSVVLTN